MVPRIKGITEGKGLMTDFAHLLQVLAITVPLAVIAWFAPYAAMGWLARALKGVIAMIQKHRTNIGRRTFPAIAWGIIGLVLALLLILVVAKFTRG